MTMSIGKALPRKEDRRLLTGGGSYSDDVHLPDLAYAIVVRSPHAHARIRAIETQAARAMPGVLAVLTGVDVVADGLKPIPHNPTPTGPPADIALKNRDGSAHGRAPHPILPTDRVRFVGDAVALVVANTLSAAKDAAERVMIDYEPLPPVTTAVAAAQGGAPRLYEHVRQRLHRRRRRRRRRDRGSIRARRPCRPSRHLGAARHRRAARCARGDRRL